MRTCKGRSSTGRTSTDRSSTGRFSIGRIPTVHAGTLSMGCLSKQVFTVHVAQVLPAPDGESLLRKTASKGMIPFVDVPAQQEKYDALRHIPMR